MRTSTSFTCDTWGIIIEE